VKKTVLSLAAVLALAIPAAASAAPLLRVDDPTPNKAFSGQTNGKQYSGYVAVYADGVEACNANPAYTRPDNGEPITGYIWVGPAHTPTTPLAALPGNVAGAGNNRAVDDPATPADESHGPCADK
jgi:hypothetical protein